MSIPRDHHYLPQFYLERWVQGGRVVRYLRPCGSDGPLHHRMESPRAVCFETDLYQLPDLVDPTDSQFIEMNLFQRIDNNAALALNKFDLLREPTVEDHDALCQFVVSLLHRTPDRIAALRKDLAKQTDGAPYAGLIGKEYDDKLKATTNRLLAMLLESNDTLSHFSKFKAGRIVVTGASKSLLTSDRPMTASAQLIADDAYILLPYGPDRLLILTHDKLIARSFQFQADNYPNKFVSSINQAIVEQAETIVIANDTRATKMIDRLFLRPQPDRVVCPAGLIRRKAPMPPRHVRIQ